MARKQQSSLPKKTNLEEIHRRRVELETILKAVQSEIQSIQHAFSELEDQKVVQQHRRKLQYPSEL